MSKDQRLYLHDILERITRIEEIAAAGEATFRASAMHQDAIIRNFEVIGEIVKRLDEDLLLNHPQVLWADYAGFRDVLIHQYDKVILDVVWESAKNDLAPLRDAINIILTESFGNIEE